MDVDQNEEGPGYAIGSGKMAGKAVYANRNFQPGEVVLKYNWQEITTEQWTNLPEQEKQFAHSFWGRIQLFGIPERYVNHSDQPNTRQDLHALADRATQFIRSGEEITTDTRLELKNELESLLGMTGIKIGDAGPDIRWTEVAYNSARCLYCPAGGLRPTIISLKRSEGRWRISSRKAGL